MKLRRLLKLLLILLLGLLVFMLIRSFQLSSKQVEVEASLRINLDSPDFRLLAEAIKLPTISTYKGIDTAAFLDFDTLIMQRFPLVDSLLVRREINHFSNIYEWRGSNPDLLPVLALAHKDVVPIDSTSIERWLYPAFSGKIDEDMIYGRGSLDDKLSVIGWLQAIERLLSEGFVPERSLVLAFGHDEEIGGVNGAVAMANYFERKGKQFEFILDEGLVVLEEALEGLEKPVALIGVGEKGYATFKLQVVLDHGGHSSMPPKNTAIGILSAAINAIEQNPMPAKMEGLPQLMFDYLAPEMTFFNKFALSNLWAFEGLLTRKMSAKPTSNALLRTTYAPTIISAGIKDNVLPSEATAVINTRIVPGESIESTLQYIRKIISNPLIEIGVDPDTQSSEPTDISSSSSFGFNVLQLTAQSVFTDAVVAPSMVIATTDSRYYTHLAEDVYRFLPVQLSNEDLHMIHGSDEKISKKNYENVVNFYYHLIKNINS